MSSDATARVAEEIEAAVCLGLFVALGIIMALGYGEYLLLKHYFMGCLP